MRRRLLARHPLAFFRGTGRSHRRSRKSSREGPKVVNLAFTRGREPAEDLHLDGVVIGAIGTQWLAHRRDARV